MNGFRQQPTTSRKDKLRQLEVELKNMQMAARISQMMTQQLMQNNQNISQDLGRALGLINELQYKILAIQRASGLDVAALAAAADELRLKDFNEASDKEDADLGLLPIDTVEEDSTVILTSTTASADTGIFRSKIKLADSGVPELVKSLTGQKVGTKVKVQLNGLEHEVELLGVRRPPRTEGVALPAEMPAVSAAGQA